MKIIRTIAFMFCCIFITGCGKEVQEEGNFALYYVNEDGTTIDHKSMNVTETDTEKLVNTVLKTMNRSQQKGGRILPDKIQINSYEISGDIITVDFQSSYYQMTKTDEVLWRGAIVKNLLQIPGIGYVKFTINGEELLDSKGDPVGFMSGYSFLEYSGKDITAYQYTEMELYFADKSGEKLVPEKRAVYYTSNSPIEKVVVEQLIRGPKNEEHYPTIPSRTRILNVSVSEGIAYVNLDQRFITEALPLKEQIPIYSIVNSLISLGTVEKVQISINGDTKINFKDTVKLDQLFEMNTEYCE